MRMLANSAIDDAMNKVMDAFKDQGVDLPSNMVRLSAGLTAVAPRLTECPDQVMSQAMREAVEEVRQEEGEGEGQDERPGDAPSSTDNPGDAQPGGEVPSP